MTRLKLSIKELTATRSMRFVVALYSVRRIVSSVAPEEAETVENSRCTDGESSLSTLSEPSATLASLAVGNGTSMVLEGAFRARVIWR